MLTMIAKPIFWVMTQMHAMLGNWGWTIIALTILIKLAVLPAVGGRLPQHGQDEAWSRRRCRRSANATRAIRSRCNQATMELYKTEKINPLGGCLPILVQMPVFIALYWVLQASVEMRGAPWIGWIQDLTAA